MADISMCSTTECPLKAKCYRHTAIENEYWQSWSSWTPTKVKGKWTCEGFWNNVRYIKIRYKCQGEVEKMGADVRLTDALNLLIEARHKIADFIDELNGQIPAKVIKKGE